jgi:creatinine amidohydrolase/Fe(II)-dependent formamide hydrolase-like protein
MDKAVAEKPSVPIAGAPFAGLHKLKINDVSFPVFRSSNEETKSGALGDPMAATPEKGKAIIDGGVDATVAFLNKFQAAEETYRWAPCFWSGAHFLSRE